MIVFIYSGVESYIIEQVRRIILERSLSYNETLPDVGNIPIFPDRDVYKVKILLINNIIWVEFHRDQFAIDAFEIIVQDGKVICIEPPIISDSSKTVYANYNRTVVAEFVLSDIEFLSFHKRVERKLKINCLYHMVH